MKDQLTQALAAAVRETYQLDLAIELSRPDPQFGDYATNVALQLAAQVGQKPRDIAERLAAAVREKNGPIIETLSVAGPGFLNITVKNDSLQAELKLLPQTPYAGKIVLAEYSDPNPFKPLHAGHLYTTLVGDTLARLFEVAGGQVTRISYGGDVGLHVGKALWAIIGALGGENIDDLVKIPAAERSQWLGERYVEGNNAYEDDETLRQEIIEVNKRVYALHANGDHDSSFAQIYWTCRQWSYDHFNELYDQLQVQQFDRIIPESEIVPLGLKTVQEQLKAGIYTESDGAVIFKGEDFGLHTRVFINSSGLPTYEAKDVGLLLTKWRDYHFDKSFVITANEQEQYMAVMLKSVSQFDPEPAERSRHLTHGIVKLQGGVKMSSRKGNTVSALDIIAAARAANKQVTGQDNDDTVLGAIKYAFLKNRIGGDIIYDPIESVSLEGNSGPYLQYAHARARSILAKAGDAPQAGMTDLQPAERQLVAKLTEYVEAVDKAVNELMPHHICTYLYELSQTFNRFYEHNRVIGDGRQAMRLTLISQYANTLQAGLRLLGIVAPEKM
jgi:arginyl-tRNA synthetase